jgi:hypothetical protein
LVYKTAAEVPPQRWRGREEGLDRNLYSRWAYRAWWFARLPEAVAVKIPELTEEIRRGDRR